MTDAKYSKSIEKLEEIIQKITEAGFKQDHDNLSESADHAYFV